MKLLALIGIHVMRGLLAAGTVFITVASSAYAATISQTASFELAVTNSVFVISSGFDSITETDTEAKTFAEFDASLGSLSEVKFTLDSDVAGDITVSGSGSSDGNFSANYDPITAKVGSPSIGTLFEESFSSPDTHVSCGGSLPCTDTNQFNFAFDDTATASDPSTFVGPGTFTVNLDLLATLRLSTSGFSVIGTAQGDIAWSGSLTVEYVFSPHATVAEPGTAALLGIGLAGLGFIRRKPSGPRSEWLKFKTP